jgi:cell division protein FtsI (penicillin-binding protein 3)
VRAGPEPRAARWIALRIGLLALLFAAGFAAVATRAFQLQVVRREELAGEAVNQYLRELVLRPRRGVITDRNGVLLAGSADTQSVYVDPKLLAESGRGGALLREAARILKIDRRTLDKRVAKGSPRFAWLARRVAPSEAAALRAWLDGARVRAIGLVPETRRFYPKAELAEQLLGVVDDDGVGREGVELAQDEMLQGEPEKVPSLRDGRGRVVLAEAPGHGREREGARVELTIDQGLQVAAERALARAVAGSRALSGMAVVLAPGTGEVLALASWPAANANAPRTADQLRNRPVTDAFEPGSTVKTFSIAAALEAGVLQPLDPIDCGNGRYAIGGHVIHDHAPVGWTGASRVLAQSSNIGAAKIAARLGRERLFQGLQAFGVGERTGIGLPGEVRGQLTLARSDIGLATQSFGQGPITATALQLTAAMGAIANGGVLVRPRIVKKVVDPATGEVLSAPAPEIVRRVVSAQTAATVARWLVGVVEDPKGTGRRAALDGWRAAGKTGTAQKVDRISGGYSADRHFSSFVGFAPADEPRVVIGVFVDEPKGEIHGGEVAAPPFREIAEYALKMMDVRPASALAAAPRPAPAVVTAPEESGDVEAPVPTAPLEWAEPVQSPGGRVTVPALAGLTARRAIRELESLELGADMRGSGRVVSQTPPAGRVVERGTRVRMKLAPAG